MVLVITIAFWRSLLSLGVENCIIADKSKELKYDGKRKVFVKFEI